MARKKISEFRAKTLLNAALGRPYAGLLVDGQADWRKELKALAPRQKYVVKVDQGVKGRFKKGLVKLNLTSGELEAAIAELGKQGYRYGLAEEYRAHESADEGYLALERQREGVIVSMSVHGGIDVEAASDIQRMPYSEKNARLIEQRSGFDAEILGRIVELFERAHMVFLEINPYVLVQGQPHFLDAAVEVDGEAALLVDGAWSEADFRNFSGREKSAEEQAVDNLAATSQASFRLEVLNPDGSVFMLLSGGGASVALADEVHNQGRGNELGNYGEYSGNPSEEETYRYTQAIVSAMLKSMASGKVLVIAGGVANFTDVRVTFKGIIRALKEVEPQLKRQGIRVYVRRGGPHEAEGLSMMRSYLEGAGLLGLVAGPEMVLPQIVAESLSPKKKGVAA